MQASFNPHELYLVYDPSTEVGKKTYAIARSTHDVIHEINILKQPVSPLHWKEIADLLKIQPLELINHQHKDFERLIGNDSYSEKDALEILHKNPELLLGPIGILQKKAIICREPMDIQRLEAQTFHPSERF